jgi:hypothetical protein
MRMFLSWKSAGGAKVNASCAEVERQLRGRSDLAQAAVGFCFPAFRK